MSIRDKFAAGRFVVTSEIGPPKGVDTSAMLRDAEMLANKVDALNVTDQQSAVMRLGSLAVCRMLVERGIEPIFQLTCRDRNRIALQSDLLSAHVMGIENILCLTGDHVVLGDHLDAKPVFDLDSVSLLQAATALENGRDLANKELKGKPRFFLGAVVTPGAEPLEPQIIKLEKKVQAGAQFIQTQAIYEPERFEIFAKAIEFLRVPIMVGIVLIKSAGMARFMNRNVAGVHVPEHLIDEMDDAASRSNKSIEIASRLIQEMRGMCQGVHIMPIGWERHVPAVLDAAGLL